MTKFFTTALCTAAAASAGLLFIATSLAIAGQTVAAGVCLLSAGVVLYGVCVAVGWNVAIKMLKGE